MKPHDRKLLEIAQEYLKKDKVLDLPKFFQSQGSIIPMSYVLVDFLIYYQNSHGK